MFSLTPSETKFLKKLNTPEKIQDYLDSIPFNFEKHGETCMSPRRTMREKKAHCFEGALLAAAALWLHGKKPLLLSLQVTDEDWPHALTLYKVHGYWGAISKTNHAVLRFRDPIYKTIRELVLSYFHEYFLISNGKKTLRKYSRPINLSSFGTAWITSEENLWEMSELINALPHTAIIPKGNEKHIRPATTVERKAASLVEWKK